MESMDASTLLLQAVSIEMSASEVKVAGSLLHFPREILGNTRGATLRGVRRIFGGGRG